MKMTSPIELIKTLGHTFVDLLTYSCLHRITFCLDCAPLGFSPIGCRIFGHLEDS